MSNNKIFAGRKYSEELISFIFTAVIKCRKYRNARVCIVNVYFNKMFELYSLQIFVYIYKI